MNLYINTLFVCSSYTPERKYPLPSTGKARSYTIAHPYNLWFGARKNGKRKEELKQFLVSNGPSKRAKIIAESGIPRGTIAYLLNSNSEFVRRDDGKWQVDVAPPQVQ